MKASFYNFEFPYGEGSSQTILYNAMTNAMALIESEQYAEYKAFCADGTEIANEKLLHDLTYGGFLIDENMNELELIQYRLLQSRFSTNRLSLTLAPTSDCNFRCIYCYEKDSLRHSTMTEEVQQGVIDYIKRLAPNLSSLYISWYGGEPLLALDIIERLTKEVVEICQENKIEYSAGIVTNGYLLTPETAKKLGEFHVSNIQITLDGSREQHDKRRFLEGGLPTFDKIISNLKEAKEALPCQVSIRVNVDKQNVSQVDEILNILQDNGLSDVTSAYLGMVENSNETYLDSKCYCTQEFSELDYNFMVRNHINRVGRYPQLVHNVCSADAVSVAVIDSDGMVYKCWNDIGKKERAIASLLDSTFENRPVFFSYLLYDPTRDEECKVCKYLPICMGGCPHRRQFAAHNRCNRLKYTMEKYISDIALQLKRDREMQEQKKEDEEKEL